MTSLKWKFVVRFQVKTRGDLFRVNLDVVLILRRIFFIIITNLDHANLAFLSVVIRLEEKTDIIKQFAHQFSEPLVFCSSSSSFS